VVFQAVWPQKRVGLFQSAYHIAANQPERIPIFVYNFGSKPVEGRLSVVAPKGWKLSLPDRVKVQPGERVELALAVDLRGATSLGVAPVIIRGDFPSGGTPIFSLRLSPETR
jgi:hypothetical protein